MNLNLLLVQPQPDGRIAAVHSITGTLMTYLTLQSAFKLAVAMPGWPGQSQVTSEGDGDGEPPVLLFTSRQGYMHLGTGCLPSNSTYGFGTGCPSGLDS